MKPVQINPEKEYYLRGPLVFDVPPADSLLIRIDNKFSDELELTRPYISAKLLGEIAAHQLDGDTLKVHRDTHEAISQLHESRQSTIDVWLLQEAQGLFFALNRPTRNDQPSEI